MKVQTIYKDTEKSIKAIFYPGEELLYTITRTYDEEGYVKRETRVFKDGSVSEQNF